MIDIRGIYGPDVEDKIIEDFAMIEALDFDYQNPDEIGEDDKEHIGVSAQTLESLPTTASVVETLEDGTKALDAKALSAVEAAAIGELSRRVIALETIVKELSEKTNG